VTRCVSLVMSHRTTEVHYLGESAQDNAQAVHVETFRSGGFLYHRFAACQVVKVFSTHSLACVLVRPAVAFTCEGIILGSLVFERWHAERTVARDRLRVAPRRQRRVSHSFAPIALPPQLAMLMRGREGRKGRRGGGKEKGRLGGREEVREGARERERREVMGIKKLDQTRQNIIAVFLFRSAVKHLVSLKCTFACSIECNVCPPVPVVCACACASLSLLALSLCPSPLLLLSCSCFSDSSPKP